MFLNILNHNSGYILINWEEIGNFWSKNEITFHIP